MNLEKLMNSFEPHWAFRGGFLQTVMGSQIPGQPLVFPDKIRHVIDLDVDAKAIMFEVVATDKSKPLVLLAHGMGGCSESGYIKRIAEKLWSQGYGVFLANHRGSGSGMGLSSSLWNGGSSDDLGKMVEFIFREYPLQNLILIGFSLSGNIILKYLGEGRSIFSGIIGALAVNPPIDLRVSSHILSNKNWLFNRYFMKLLGRQAEALMQHYPTAMDPRENLSTIWNFDVSYTAPAGGYKDVEDYYNRCSANSYLKNIHIPTTILCSLDDPFVPPEVFKNLSINGAVTLYQPERGGHMGYISRHPTPKGDHRWMDFAVLEWVREIRNQEVSI